MSGTAVVAGVSEGAQVGNRFDGFQCLLRSATLRAALRSCGQPGFDECSSPQGFHPPTLDAYRR
jgi:hypothetical protein